MDSYFDAMSDSAELLSDKTLKRLGTIFIELYVEEIDKYLEKDEKERERKRNVYHGDYSNGILSFLALSPVFSFHLSIKVGLWILTELTEFSTRRLSWMKRERRITKSWIHLSIPILSSRLIGAWSIETLQNHKTIGLSKLDTPIALLIRTDITFIDQPLSIRVLLLQ